MKVLMTVVTALTTKEAMKRFGAEVEDRTCSKRCHCDERLWLAGSWWHHYDTLLECSNCKALHLSTSLRRTDLKEFKS